MIIEARILMCTHGCIFIFVFSVLYDNYQNVAVNSHFLQEDEGDNIQQASNSAVLFDQITIQTSIMRFVSNRMLMLQLQRDCWPVRDLLPILLCHITCALSKDSSSVTSLASPNEKVLVSWLPNECTTKTLIRMYGCTDWSEPLLGARAILLDLLLCCYLIYHNCLQKWFAMKYWI